MLSLKSSRPIMVIIFSKYCDNTMSTTWDKWKDWNKFSSSIFSRATCNLIWLVTYSHWYDCYCKQYISPRMLDICIVKLLTMMYFIVYPLWQKYNKAYIVSSFRMISWRLWAQLGIEVWNMPIFRKLGLNCAHAIELQLGASLLPAIS